MNRCASCTNILELLETVVDQGLRFTLEERRAAIERAQRSLMETLPMATDLIQ
jgi:hypothetical protein